MRSRLWNSALPYLELQLTPARASYGFSSGANRFSDTALWCQGCKMAKWGKSCECELSDRYALRECPCRMWPSIPRPFSTGLRQQARLYVPENTTGNAFPTPGTGKVIRFDGKHRYTETASGFNLPTSMSPTGVSALLRLEWIEIRP